MKFRFLLLGLIFLAIAGCWSQGPADVVQEFYENVESGKIEATMKLFSDGTRRQLPEDKLKAGLQATTRSIAQKDGVKEFKVVNEEIIGEIAEVDVEIVFGDDTKTTDKVSLVKEDGKWRIQSKGSK